MSQSTHDHAHSTSNRQYFTTWCWLLVMTMFALAIGYVHHARGIKAVLLVGTTLAKILLIGRIFMHLKFEKDEPRHADVLSTVVVCHSVLHDTW